MPSAARRRAGPEAAAARRKRAPLVVRTAALEKVCRWGKAAPARNELSTEHEGNIFTHASTAVGGIGGGQERTVARHGAAVMSLIVVPPSSRPRLGARWPGPIPEGASSSSPQKPRPARPAPTGSQQSCQPTRKGTTDQKCGHTGMGMGGGSNQDWAGSFRRRKGHCR